MTRTEHSPLLAVATPDEVARLAAYATRIAPKMTTDMTQGRPDRAAALVRFYDGLCRSVGLDTVLAVAQTWHETGFWSGAPTSWWFHAPRRNPAGIAVNGAVLDAPGKSGEWHQTPSGKWAKGRAFPSYATATMAHVHGLALWAGAPAPAVAMLAARCRAAGVTPYSPPMLARGSARTPLELGQAYNSRKIGWAFPGHAPHVGTPGKPGYRKIDADEALRLGKTYGHGIARAANEALR